MHRRCYRAVCCHRNMDKVPSRQIIFIRAGSERLGGRCHVALGRDITYALSHPTHGPAGRASAHALRSRKVRRAEVPVLACSTTLAVLRALLAASTAIPGTGHPAHQQRRLRRSPGNLRRGGALAGYRRRVSDRSVA